MSTLLRTLVSAAVVVAAVWFATPAATSQETQEDDKDIAVQARGPVHEAYAQPMEHTVKTNVIAPKAPPAPIPEIPPDAKPEGENVQWIPGYWAWDGDKKDFLWISGFWRQPPPNRRWVPGHWVDADGGKQWIAGFWEASKTREVKYLETAPPPSIDNGPSTPAPDDDSIYVPGVWQQRESRYAWRPGYWSQPVAGWLWCPAHYYWTPNGYIYVSGYWDYPLEERGLLYAPVYFHRPLWLNAGWYWRPRIAVSLGGFYASLWVRPGYGHYYFGDYYGPLYAGLGWSPWYLYGPRYYDPLFSFYRWNNRGNYNRWYGGLHSTFVARSSGGGFRPAHTFAAQGAVLSAAASRGANVTTLRTVQPASQINSSALRMSSISSAQVASQRTGAQQVRSLSTLRTQTETVSRPAAASAGTARVTTSGGGATAPRVVRGVSAESGHVTFSSRTLPLPQVASHSATVSHSVSRSTGSSTTSFRGYSPSYHSAASGSFHSSGGSRGGASHSSGGHGGGGGHHR